MAEVKIVITDYADGTIKVRLESDPKMPKSAKDETLAQRVGFQLVEAITLNYLRHLSS